MTELERILHTSSDELELGLLRSADRDDPSPAAFSKTAVALGLGGLTLSVAGGAGAAGGGAVATGIVLAGSIWVAALKALAIGATSGLLISAGVQAVSSEPPREETASTASKPGKTESERADKAQQATAGLKTPSSTGAPAQLAETLTPVLPSDGVSSAATPKDTQRGATSGGSGAVDRSLQWANGIGSNPAGQLSRIAPARAAFDSLDAARVNETEAPPHAPSAAPTASANRTVARMAPPVSIAEEVRTLDRARQALSGGRAREALNELERYQSQWPRGVFASEVLVLRVEAKLKLGDRASAEREARRLIDAQPKSRHAARLRALLGIVE